MGLIENDASNNSSIVPCVFVTTVVNTEPLPSNDSGIHIQTHKPIERKFILKLKISYHKINLLVIKCKNVKF
jgi:hypothetical protein